MLSRPGTGLPRHGRPRLARSCRSLATASLTFATAIALAVGGTLGVTAGASAESAPNQTKGGGSIVGKARDLRHPTSVGAAAAGAGLPVLPRTSVVEAQAAALTCRPLEAFSRTEDGSLYRLLDSSPGPTKGQTLTETGKVGTGWSAGKIAWIGGGGYGVIYALTWSGDLRWYRYDAATRKWLANSGRAIAKGLVPVKKIVNISVGTGGNIYVVRTDGKLVLHRHRGLTTGAISWAKAGGWVIGSGFSGKEIIAPVGDGTVYRQSAGRLFWYRHTDPARGAVKWQRRTLLNGWNFYDLLSTGGGVLYATVPGSGQIRVYAHADPVRSGGGFPGTQGVVKGFVRANSYGVAIDPGACRRA